MRQPWKHRQRFERLAPVGFVSGLVLLGLSLLAVTFTATAPGHGPIEAHESTVVNETAVLAYPVPVSPYVATRVDASFEFPHDPGSAMILDCAGYSAVLQGKDPVRVRTATTGTSGRLSSGTAPDAFGDAGGPSAQCPFVYAIFQWSLEGGTPDRNRPEVQVKTSPMILPTALNVILTATGIVGFVLTIVGGTAWTRRLGQARKVEPAGDGESTTETLLVLIGKTGDWLTRTRRYLVLAGIVGIFLWYPVVLPWAWNTAMEGSVHRLDPWLVTLAALTILLVLTILWARAYLRLDRELVAWRERMDRLREREAEVLADLQASG